MDSAGKTLPAEGWCGHECPAWKPLIDVSDAIYLIGSALPGTMSARSKMAFADAAVAELARSVHGGELDDFDAALLAAYQDIAQDTVAIRKRRAERRARMQRAM
jgi:copper chaperone NosL